MVNGVVKWNGEEELRMKLRRRVCDTRRRECAIAR